jgi:hypothetical protein
MRFFILLFLVGCAVNNVKYKMPAARFNTPEVTGGSLFTLDLKGRANVNYGSSNRVSTTDVVADSIGVNSSGEIIEDSSQLGARLDLSIFDRMDLYWNYTMDSPTTLGIKWQFVGFTEQEFKEGWKSSITAGFGSSDTGSKLIPIENAASTTYIEGTNETDVYDIYAMIGYRFSGPALLYLNLNYTLYKNELSYEKANAEEEIKNFDSENLGVILGFQYYFKSKESFLLVELGYTMGDVEPVSENDILTGGINFGWRFD